MAKQDRATQQAQILADIPNNNSELITPAKERGVMANEADSALYAIDDTGLANEIPFTNATADGLDYSSGLKWIADVLTVAAAAITGNLTVGGSATISGDMTVLKANQGANVHLDANRSGNTQTLGNYRWLWNGTTVAQISGYTGTSSGTTKDDINRIDFDLKKTGVAIATVLSLKPDSVEVNQNATFSSSITANSNSYKNHIIIDRTGAAGTNGSVFHITQTYTGTTDRLTVLAENSGDKGIAQFDYDTSSGDKSLNVLDKLNVVGTSTFSGQIQGDTIVDEAGTGAPNFTNGLKAVNTINEFSTDGTLAGNSDSAVPTEKAVKTYVDDNTVGITSGSWTPIAVGYSGTLNILSATYYKIGDRVFVDGYISFNGADASNCVIGGLPYAIKVASNYTVVGKGNYAIATETCFFELNQTGSTQFSATRAASSGSVLNYTTMQDFRFHINYDV